MAWVTWVLGGAVVLLGIAIWSVKRHLRDQRRDPARFHDRALAKRLEEIFEDDRKHCIELNADHWKRRGLLHQAQDSALYLFNEVL